MRFVRTCVCAEFDGLVGAEELGNFLAILGQKSSDRQAKKLLEAAEIGDPNLKGMVTEFARQYSGLAL